MEDRAGGSNQKNPKGDEGWVGFLESHGFLGLSARKREETHVMDDEATAHKAVDRDLPTRGGRSLVLEKPRR